MLKNLMKWFDRPAEKEKENEGACEERVRVAACALLLEMAQTDEEFHDLEKEKIIQILKEHYDLGDEDAQALMQAADEELENSVQLFQFTRLINQNYSNSQKIEVIELVWKVIYADGKLDKYEDHLAHQLAKMLNLTHKQLIDAKMKIKNEQS